MQNSIEEILRRAETIAVVGLSDSMMRDSYRIGKMLVEVGYKVYPVNPTIDSFLDIPSYPDLKSLPEPVDIVNVFRNSRYAKEIVRDTIEIGGKVIWFQYGAEEDEAEAMGREAGLEVISGYCIGVEIRRRGIVKSSVPD